LQRRLPVCCIAGCHPADVRLGQRAADWQSAKQQIGNLRYVKHIPGILARRIVVRERPSIRAFRVTFTGRQDADLYGSQDARRYNRKATLNT